MGVKGFAGAALVCAMLAIAPAAALAGRGHYPNGSRGAHEAQAIARAAWHGNPCGGHVTIGWSPMAWDTYSASMWDVVTPGDRMIDCHIAFNSRVTFTWSRFCTIMVHEYGHLTGHDHVPDPNSIMYARPRIIWPACERAAARR